ncbi:MAG: hypothetical protein Q9163_002604 [Psora crenata]
MHTMSRHDTQLEVIDLTLDEPSTNDLPQTNTEVQDTSTHRNVWSSGQRKALRVLVEGYGNDWSDIVPVFNSYSQLSAPQARGIPKRVIRTQWNYIKRTSSRIKSTDLKASYPSSHAEEENIRKTLEDLAIRLGIQLRRQGKNSPLHIYRNMRSDRSLLADKLHSSPQTPSRLMNQDHDNGLLTPPRSQPSDSIPQVPRLSIGRSPTRRSTKAIATPPPMIIPQSPSNITPPLNGDLPSLGFRGFSQTSQGKNGGDGFIAGAFVDSARIPACPTPNSPDFRNRANKHVGWDKDHKSPFISLTISPIRAMIRARGPISGRYIAIIDLHKVNQNGSIFAANTLNLTPTRGNGAKIIYYSGGEYLVWGQLHRSEIISVIAVDELAESCPSIPYDPDPFLIGFIITARRRVAWSSWLPTPWISRRCWTPVPKQSPNMIKGESAEEIRKTFNIQKGLTPEEEDQIRRENEWAGEQDLR